MDPDGHSERPYPTLSSTTSVKPSTNGHSALPGDYTAPPRSSAHRTSDSRDFGHLLDAINIGASSPDRSRSSHSRSDSSTWVNQNQNNAHQQRVQKRKRTDSDIGTTAVPKIRRVIQDNVLQRNVAAQNMTTIVTYHAAAAQKSYGQEKRFLCPPPLVRVSGPLSAHLRHQQLKMCVVSELGNILQDHVGQFDAEHGIVCFKQLHISSQGKDKQFQLSLSISDISGLETSDQQPVAGAPPKAPWATLYSAPVHIISKPSKKTTRGNTPGISNMGMIALFNRINSQTVRTKYLSHRPPQSDPSAPAAGGPITLTTSSSHWDPFTIEIVPPEAANAPILYGSRIVLRTGPNATSYEFIVRKVEKHQSLASEYGRQVSQMQKIALMRADLEPVDGKMCYLSALVERPGPEPMPVVPGSTHPTSWRWCEVRQQTAEDGTQTEYHEVNDYATWMITSVAQFETTFFDASGGNVMPPLAPITPAPSAMHGCRWVPPLLSSQPGQDPVAHTLHMGISNFFAHYPSSPLAASWIKTPLQVWLGDLGPLPLTAEEGAINVTQQQHGFVFPATPVHPNVANGSANGNGTSGSSGQLAGSSSSHNGPVASTSAGPGLGPGGGVVVLGNSPPTLRDPPFATYVTVYLPPMEELVSALLDSVRTRRRHAQATTSSRSMSATLQRSGHSRSASISGSGTPRGDRMSVDRPYHSRQPSTSNQRYTSGSTPMHVDDSENDIEQDESSHRDRPSFAERLEEESDAVEEEDVQTLWERKPSLPILFIRGPPDETAQNIQHYQPQYQQRIAFHSGLALRCVAASGEGPENLDGWSVRIDKVQLGSTGPTASP
ncbi:hypothetical protein PIIN_01256 [Serendipita indica DSM 11827]|uniref:Uncharacterized protein n=1 Tax=Serendipita indica (strain DSM 11827) TaxID=1109443 RepID=G4T7Y2_SERID|nr:hypothetical protein PIIN_01256 [Serendipita indica DSM 11827]